jgi:Tol biopolymer transport system component
MRNLMPSRSVVLILLGVACACEPTITPSQVETLQRWTFSRATWATANYEVSRDGALALGFVGFGHRSERQLIDLSTGQSDRARLPADFYRVVGVRFYGEDKIAWFGERGDHLGWFLEGPNGLVSSPVPLKRPRWSPDGSRIADRGGNELLIISLPEEVTRYRFDGNVLGAAWSPDGRLVYPLIWREEEGSGALFRLELESGEVGLIKEPLDIVRRGPSPGISSDGRILYIELASPGAPDPEARHDPSADRDLDIYQLDLETGQLRVVVNDPGDDFFPIVADGWLYWTHNDYSSSVVLVPDSGGRSRALVDDGALPYWHPNSRRLGFTYRGSWLADWALNFDAAFVDLDENAYPVSSSVPIIVGYHEDFTPVWSPDGEWFAYHSHRSDHPVSHYSAEGSTDDIYLRRPQASQEDEIRLTDFGWEVGNPDWSPDGRKLVFTSWSREAEGLGEAWVVTIDPATGESIRAEKLVVPEGIGSVSEVRWSPAGELALLEDLEGSRRALWIMSETGSWAERLWEFDNGRLAGFDWTPDGKSIVFSAPFEDRMQLFRIPRSGGEPERLSTDEANLTNPQVSPDGRWIACTRVDHSKELRRMKLK